MKAAAALAVLTLALVAYGCAVAAVGISAGVDQVWP